MNECIAQIASEYFLNYLINAGEVKMMNRKKILYLRFLSMPAVPSAHTHGIKIYHF